MSSEERVIIKYCGGCNPRYDRVEAASDLKKKIAEPETFGEDTYTVAVCGCPAACIWKGELKKNPLAYKITSPEDKEKVLRDIREREGIKK